MQEYSQIKQTANLTEEERGNNERAYARENQSRTAGERIYCIDCRPA
jgi:hypothetical protein